MALREHRDRPTRPSLTDQMLDESIHAALRDGVHPTGEQRARARARLMQAVYVHPPMAEDEPLFRLDSPWAMVLRLRDALVRLIVDDRVYDRARELAASKSRHNLHRHYAILSLRYSG